MKFTLSIDCDNAAFAPLNDDAGEAERYRAAMREIYRILHTKGWSSLRPEERSGTLRDVNGNRCGSWSLDGGAGPVEALQAAHDTLASEAAALQFAGGGSDDNTPQPPAPLGPGGGGGLPAKFRELADNLQRDIDHKLGERLTNTPKRQREAQSARLDGYQYERAQKALRLLADLHERGEVPQSLERVTTKAAVLELVRADIARSGGYYDAGHETGRPALDTPAAVELWALVTAGAGDTRPAEELRAKVEGLRFANIPGFFPTPAQIVRQMIEAADIADGCRVLEPSAGTGAILDGLRQACPSCELVAYERQCSLADVLKLKGYPLAGADFMESDTSQKAARVLMNPPFERGQDIEHVRRAFDHLAPGGRLVAIMSQGTFFRQDAKAREFREWFDGLGGEIVAQLPAGSFKESGTGVVSVMIEIRS